MKTFLSLVASLIFGMILFGGLYGLSSLLKSDPLVVFATVILTVATVSVIVIDKADKKSVYQRKKKKE